MNIFDVLVLIILAACMYGAYRKGLIRSLFGLVSSVGALLITNALYPRMSRFLRETEIYTMLKQWVINSMGLEEVVHEQTVKAQTELINSLSLPDMVTQSMLANNNPEIYKLLRVSTIADYVSGYFANVLINVLSFVIVLVLVRVAFSIVGQMLGIFAELPVLKTFDKLGGLAAGFVEGSMIIWIMFVILSLFFMKPEYGDWYQRIKDSVIAARFYENNILMGMILQIFP